MFVRLIVRLHDAVFCHTIFRNMALFFFANSMKNLAVKNIRKTTKSRIPFFKNREQTVNRALFEAKIPFKFNKLQGQSYGSIPTRSRQIIL